MAEIREGTNLFNSLEEIVDGSTLKDTLDALVRICEGKAEHLLMNWQDKGAAKVWRKSAVTIDNILRRIEV